LNLFNKYLILVTFETDDNYSIRNEKHYSHSTTDFNEILYTDADPDFEERYVTKIQSSTDCHDV